MSTRYYEMLGGARSDALLDGLNAEISVRNSMVTSPGFTSAAQPGSMLGVISAVMFSGTQLLYDQTTKVSHGANTLYTKSTAGVRAQAQTVGNYTFLASPPDIKMWDGTSATADEVGTPQATIAPTLTPAAGTTMKASFGWTYVYSYYSGKYSHPGTASPASASTGSGSWSSITVTGPSSSDSNVNYIQIYRSTDGGVNFEFLAQIANPGSGNWSYTDSSADAALNPFVLAPVYGANNQPPSGITSLAYHSNRLWGAVGNTVYYSGGPDTTSGNGLLAWPTNYFFTFPYPVIRLEPYPNGLLVFTTVDTYAILGTCSSVAILNGATGIPYFTKIQQAGIGLSSYYALDKHGNDIYLFTTQRQFLCMSPGAGVVDMGFAIGDKLALFTPSSVFVAYYQNGEDEAVYVCDGSANIYRLAPHQYPEGGPCWSPVRQPTFGCSFLQAMYDTTNTPRLYVVDSSGAGFYYRDPSVYTDNGTSYASWYTAGPIILALPGELAEAESLTVEALYNATQPTVSVLLNEVSGTFTALTSFVQDPVELAPLTSLNSNRYYLAQGRSGVLARMLQLKIAFTSGLHEVLGYTIFGKVLKNE